VIKLQVKDAPAAAVVVLHMLWTHMELLGPQREKKKLLYLDAAGPLKNIEEAIKVRDEEIKLGKWGVGRRGTSAVITHENWTRLMRENLVKRQAKLKKKTDIDALKKAYDVVQGQFDRLKAQIETYYARTGALGRIRPLDKDLAFLARYPVVYAHAKKRLCDTQKAHEEAISYIDALQSKKKRIKAKVK